MRSDDIATLITQSPQPGLEFRQGVVVTWDSVTGENVIRVGAGGTIPNVPRLASVPALNPGDVVALLKYASTYLVLGRIVG